MSPTRRVKPSDLKNALEGQLCMHSDTGAALEGLHDEDEVDVDGQSSEENEDLDELQGGFLRRLQTMRGEISGVFEVDEDEEGVMQEFQFQRRRDSSASNVGLFQHALDSDDNENELFSESSGAVGGAACVMDNNSVTAGPSSLTEQYRPFATSSLETGSSGGRGCFALGEYVESTRLLVDEVDQRRSERRRGLNLGTSLSRGVLSLYRQRGSGEAMGSIIYQQVREEDEDKENENQGEMNANERQQSTLPIEVDMEPDIEQEIPLSVCVMISALRVVKLNNNDDREV